MTPEELMQKLEEAAPENLKSVILYGSAAAGDYSGKNSDYNILVVAETLGHKDLKCFSRSARKWEKSGNPAPLLFTEKGLKEASDVFPIEFLDIKDCHKVLYGEDLIKDIEIGTENLRLEIEHEMRGKLIQLRQRFMIESHSKRALAKLMINSLATFLVLFRAALRLFDEEIPIKKQAAIDKLSQHIDFDTKIFKTIGALKNGELKFKQIDPEILFGEYLRKIESIVNAVDSFIKENGS